MGRYKLKKGVLLRAFSDSSKTCTADTITDELAEWHLTHNPACRRFFEKVPDTLPGVPAGLKIVQPVKQKPKTIQVKKEIVIPTEPLQKMDLTPEPSLKEGFEAVDTLIGANDDLGTAKEPEKPVVKKKVTRRKTTKKK